jgi:flavin reductase (DIM6/NTAB) family NADH-FMN oxidoreductase RutF
MLAMKHCRKLARRIIFGDTLLPQEFFIGFPDPQTEISVWFQGFGAMLDVTTHYSMACAEPFAICIAFNDAIALDRKADKNLKIKFCERAGKKRVLGEIGLRLTTVLPIEGMDLFLFAAQSSSNYCLPIIRLWANYFLQADVQRKQVNTSGMKMTFLDMRASMVNFIRPHPVVLTSLTDETGGNIFPMNIMGNLDEDHFAFALKDSRRAAHLVERIGRIAMSNIPIQYAPLAYQFAVHHTMDYIDFDKLPFGLRESSVFGIPVPEFALRVRELEIKKVHPIGSHTLFIAQIVHDEIISRELGLSVIHGFYQAWRLRGHWRELQASLEEELFYKTGRYQAIH